MKYKAIASALFNQPWFSTEESMLLMQSLLSERNSEVGISKEEIVARIEAAGGSRVGKMAARMGLDLEDTEDSEEASYFVRESVAVIPLAGSLFAKANLLTQHSGCTSYQKFEANFRHAAARSDIKSIIIDCDSPGGQVAGCKDVADMLYGARGGDKPIMAYVSGQCCSAAMYIGAACDRIISSPSSLLGSIGTLIMVRDSSGAYERAGLKMNVLRSSPLKAAGVEGEKFDGPRRDSLQHIVDQFGAEFEADIGKYRGISAAQVRERFGQGGVLTPKDALAVGMIDSISAWDDFIKPLAKASPPPGGRSGGKSMKYSQEVRGLLLGNSFIKAIDASDEVCAAALGGLGVEAENPTAKDVNERILGRMQAKSEPGITPEQVEKMIAAAKDHRPADDKTAGERQATADVNRVKDLLTARAEFVSLNLGACISEEDFNAMLVDPKMTASEATRKWTAEAAKQEKPVDRTSITGVASSYDKFLAIATPAMVQALGGEEAKTPEAQVMADKGLYEIAREDLRIRGIDHNGSNSDIMKKWCIASANPAGAVPLDGNRLVSNAYTGVGAFPSALGGLGSTMFTGVHETEEVTFHRWADKLPDADDFRPQTIWSLMGIEEFSHNPNSLEPKQMDLAEEAGFIDNDIYDGAFVWNEKMQANDGGALQQGVDGLRLGHDLKLESLCVDLATSGVTATAFDGQVVFSAAGTPVTPAARGNLLSSGGGGPTAAQMGIVRKLARGQVSNKLRGDGVNYQRFSVGSVNKVLISSYWEELAFQTFRQDGEKKVPVTDTTRNEWLGTEYIYVPKLDELTDTKYWFALFNRRRRFVSYIFQKGYGRGGQKTITVDTHTGVVKIRWSGRFGAVIVHPQCAVLNYGS